MPFNAIHEYDAVTAGNNTDIGGSNIAEGCAPSGINNALRELARQVRAAVANQGGDIASAATTSIGDATGQYVRVTGTAAITALGTVNAGVMRWVEFTAALTLTHNAASLRLPGAANIVTAAGDVGLFVSLGAGNWKCLHYSRADGSAVAGFTGTLASADSGAAEGPDFIADRASASPAASDSIGAFVMRGRDSGGNATDYARLKGKILDPANGSEDGAGILSALVAGADTPIITFGPGVQIGSPTGGDPGAGKVNATGYQVNGMAIGQIILQETYDSSSTGADDAGAGIPDDNTSPLSTEGAQLFSRAFTPLSAGSTIEVEASVHISHGTTGVQVTVALFEGTTLRRVASTENVATKGQPLRLFYRATSGNTTPRTYSIRFGGGSGTTHVNEDGAGSGMFNGSMQSYLKITEKQ